MRVDLYLDKDLVVDSHVSDVVVKAVAEEVRTKELVHDEGLPFINKHARAHTHVRTRARRSAG